MTDTATISGAVRMDRAPGGGLFLLTMPEGFKAAGEFLTRHEFVGTTDDGEPQFRTLNRAERRARGWRLGRWPGEAGYSRRYRRIR